jgi:hypothetical protein
MTASLRGGTTLKTMKFNSQICTSREQSERLLALGLKKETADMYYRFYDENTYEINPTWETIWEDRNDYKKIIPAWSLHRLLELQLNSTDTRFEIRFNQLDLKDAYDFSVGHIEHLIKEGYFNKEYLDVD